MTRDVQEISVPKTLSLGCFFVPHEIGTHYKTFDGTPVLPRGQLSNRTGGNADADLAIMSTSYRIENPESHKIGEE